MTTLRLWPQQVRRFVFIYTVIITAGFMTGLAFLNVETKLAPSGIRDHYKGTDPNQDLSSEIKFEKSAEDLLLTTHNHILGLSSVFFITGGLFWFTGWFSDRIRLVIMTEPLIALITTFGSVWLLRFIPGMDWIVWLTALSGMSMFLFFGLMAVAILVESIRPVDKK